MKQMLFTVVGTWITMAAAMGLTYLPEELFFGKEHAPVVRQIGVTVHQTGPGARIEMARELLPAGDASVVSAISVQEWRIACLPRDYRRAERPRHENVSLYLRIRNGAEKPLGALSLTLQFLNRSGYILHEERIRTDWPLAAGETGEMRRLWYAENNEFSSNDPYDIVSPLVIAGSLQTRIIIGEALFLDSP